MSQNLTQGRGFGCEKNPYAIWFFFRTCESEEREHGVVAGVDATLLSDALLSIGVAESSVRTRLRLS